MEFKNNSEQMKTVVETFVIEETASLIYDNEELERWNQMVEDLGLEGQKTIVKPEKSPIPFMYVKKSMANVFETLCPRKVSVEQYNLTPIPTEILELVVLSKRENYFEKIQIWFDDKEPDPICVGLNTTYYGYTKDMNGKRGSRTDNMTPEQFNEFKQREDYDWGTEDSTKVYLLGKWADVKHSFEELKERAKMRWMKTELASYRAQIKQYQGYIDNLEQDCIKRFE